MIDSFGIFNKANNIVKHIGTRNTLQIASELGIKIYYGDYQDLLGMYTYRWKQRIVLLNNNLDDYLRQMVLAHEIGHDTYHRDLAETGLKEFTLFNMKNDTEYVANAFASHLLLDNNEVFELAVDGYDIVQIASFLNSDIKLLLIKMQEMNKMGYNFNVPCHPERNFLKNIKA
ncbi:ImmA/IrrE family metallo-endopeptidase [Schnuerera sp. xch1]|uniref:ImmA/IrrE family metallo-endopeptidase n=1 Tax=Schnuerera sp. xch1 TaxID=2874283 RepID=UPI001CBBB8F0|nr:ImmA/IrrE family metallo-endopeptidase [Schnuerera sp. xch1]